MSGTTACDQGFSFSKVLTETCATVLQEQYPTCLDQNVPACCTSYISYALSNLECVNSYLPGCADTDRAKSYYYSTFCAGAATGVPSTSAFTTSGVVATTTSGVSTRPSGQSTGGATRGTGLGLRKTVKAAFLGTLLVWWL